jgi:hypothetical protein
MVTLNPGRSPEANSPLGRGGCGHTQLRRKGNRCKAAAGVGKPTGIPSGRGQPTAAQAKSRRAACLRSEKRPAPTCRDSSPAQNLRRDPTGPLPRFGRSHGANSPPPEGLLVSRQGGCGYTHQRRKGDRCKAAAGVGYRSKRPTPAGQDLFGQTGTTPATLSANRQAPPKRGV